MAMLTPTDEQTAILDLFRSTDDNVIINSYAGTGKTTMLKMVDKVSKRKPILYLAFNRRNVDEAERERKEAAKDKTIDCFSDHTVVQTINGCGHRAWMRGQGRPNIRLDTKKTNELFKQEIAAFKGDDVRTLWDAYTSIREAVGMAKNLGYIPDGKFPGAKRLTSREAFHAALEEIPSPFIADFIDTILFRSIKAAYDGWIDFDDQIYMPTLFGGSFPRFPLVLVDEGQDLNPVNHEMLKRLVTGRLGVVGDRFQSIYAFRGAVQAGMFSIQQNFKCVAADLSISFRCPQVIVEAARWRVPEFKWVKHGGRHQILARMRLSDIQDGATILCRNNAPLLRMAFTLLAEGRSVSVAGSEIGPRLIRLLEKIGSENDDSETLIAKINAWEHEKAQKANSPATIMDQAACLRIFATWGKNLAQAVAYAEHLFKQSGTILLSTGHKAKGLEWDNVIFLDPWLCSKEEQDLNLRYVIQTRAKQTLTEINSEGIRN